MMTFSEARPIGQIDQDRSENYRLPANAAIRVRNRPEIGAMDILRFLFAELCDAPKETTWKAIEQKYKRDEQNKWQQRRVQRMEKKRQERQEESRREEQREEQRLLNERLHAIAILPGFGSSGWMNPVIVRGLPETGTWNFEREKSW